MAKMSSASSSELSPVPTAALGKSKSAANGRGTRAPDAKSPVKATKGSKRSAEELVETPNKRQRRFAGKPSYKEEEGDDEDAPKPSPKKRGTPRKSLANGTTISVKVEAKADAVADPNGHTGEKFAKPSPKRKAKVTVKEEVKTEGPDSEGGATVTKVKRKRKTKEEKEAEAMPLAARTVGSKLYLGAHVSSAGGVHNAVMNSVQIGYGFTVTASPSPVY